LPSLPGRGIVVPLMTDPRSDSTAAGKRQLLRQALATIAYRGSRVVIDAPAEFSAFQIGASTRTPVQILAHVGDLLDWALSAARGTPAWHSSTPSTWSGEADRFFGALSRFDAYLATDGTLGWTAERLLQAPVADALTHIGQLAMLRRLAGAPVRGERFSEAQIEVGQITRNQPAPRTPFS
jgi:hypothetical protein